LINDIGRDDDDDDDDIFIVKKLDFNQYRNRDLAYYSISCKNITNIDKTLEWIIKRANPKALEGKRPA